jgi:peroxiredoxin
MISKFQSTLHVAGAFAWLVCIGAFLAGAASAEDLGPPVGLKAPDVGTRPDQTGKPRTLPDLMGKNGLVLMFFRSADWIEKRGYRVAALSYDSPEILQAFTAKRHIAFTFLSDPKSEVIDTYKLRDPQYPPGSPAYGVPRPIILILDRNEVIKAKLYEESYKVRPPVAAVISKLDEMGKGS